MEVYWYNLFVCWPSLSLSRFFSCARQVAGELHSIWLEQRRSLSLSSFYYTWMTCSMKKCRHRNLPSRWWDIVFNVRRYENVRDLTERSHGAAEKKKKEKRSSSFSKFIDRTSRWDTSSEHALVTVVGIRTEREKTTMMKWEAFLSSSFILFLTRTHTHTHIQALTWVLSWCRRPPCFSTLFSLLSLLLLLQY